MQRDFARISCRPPSSIRSAGPRRFGQWAGIVALAMLVAGCSYNISAIGGANERSGSGQTTSASGQAGQSSGASAYRAPAPAAARDYGPVLRADGTCSQPWTAAAPAAIEPGVAECALVAAKGTPVDVLIGGSGKGQREVQVLYQEPTGKKVYLFSDNKLVRVID